MAEPDGAAVTVVGIASDSLGAVGKQAAAALERAVAVVAGRRQLELFARWFPASRAERFEVAADAQAAAAEVRRLMAAGRPVTVLASGDPGFFGILRVLLDAVDRHQIAVFPAPSSVSLAFARLALPWDDAAVISVHGRPLADALAALRQAAKAAVLTSPEVPPEAVGRALLDEGLTVDLAAVCSRLGTKDEVVLEVDLRELAAGRFDPLSVVVLVGPGGLPAMGGRPEATKRLAWGLPESRYRHRAGMITKAEVRAVALAKLRLPETGVLWDLGAGSGSVGIEAALLCPGLTVFAVEQDTEAVAAIAANAQSLGAPLHVVTGRAPEATAALPAPDRVFVGGGGLAVLEAALKRLRPGGVVVATFSAVERAAAAAGLLGHLTQVTVHPGQRLPDGSWRLTGQHPVFVAFGPEEDEP